MQPESLLTDGELVERIRQRDGDALLILYRRYRLRVFALTLKILKNREVAEEVLQDVFQRLWDAPDKYDESKGQLLGWLVTVARNLSLDHKRKESRRATYHVYPNETVPMPAEDLQSIRQALATLPPEQKDVLELSYWEGLTHSELAERLGESLGTVKTRIRLGMAKVKQALRVEVCR